MSSTSKARARWNDFVLLCTTEEDATPLALVRIIACVATACHFGAHLVRGSAVFSWVHESFGGAGTRHGLLSIAGGATESSVIALTCVLVVGAALGAVGLFTRAAMLCAWLALRVLTDLNPSARGAYDALLINTIFLLVLSGSHRALSLDSLRARGTSLRCFRALLVLQIAVLYGTSALYKVGSAWTPGDASALWYILQQPLWARFPDALSSWMSVPLQLATTLSWLWELCGFPFLLVFILDEARSTVWRRRLRWGFVAFGLLMHLGIEASMEVGVFTWAALALYPAALPLESWGRLRRRFALNKQGAAGGQAEGLGRAAG